MNQLKLFSWNINHRDKAPENFENWSWIADYMLDKNPDGIVLTEYVEGKNHSDFCSKFKGYTLTVSKRLTVNGMLQNQVFVATKNEALDGVSSSCFVDFSYDRSDTSKKVWTDNLIVDCPQKKLTIIGFRMRTAIGKLQSHCFSLQRILPTLKLPQTQSQTGFEAVFFMQM
jgi:hypothetical protein